MKTQQTNDVMPPAAWHWKLHACDGVFGSVAALLLIGALLASPLSVRAGADDAGGKRALDTMTVNLYSGGGTERVMELDPSDPLYFYNLINTVTFIYYEIGASQPAARLQGVADQIAVRKPDIVALEEVTLIRIQAPGDLLVGGTTPATTIVFDYLQLLRDALAARGAHYAVAATANEIDVEMPMVNLQNGEFDDVRWTDREVILVRTDLPSGQLRVSNPQSGNFTHVIQIPAIGVSVTRGWCSVDVFLRGQAFRYICAHLEVETVPELQVLQAQELLAGPAQTALPVVLVGDFNSDPLDRDGSGALAYQTITTAGFGDTWAVLHPNDPEGGLTWGHDEFLANPGVTFDRRIDFVFFRGPGFVPTKADAIDMPLDLGAAPLWASDHAALAARLEIDRAPFAKTEAK